jgi:hypothetical protein
VFDTYLLLFLLPAFALAAVAHELGHVVAGRLAGFAIQHVDVGTGRPRLYASLLGTAWCVRRNPLHGGFVLGTRSDPHGLRGRLAVFAAGGVAANLALVAVAAWLFTGGTVRQRGFETSRGALAAVILANVWVGWFRVFGRHRLGGVEIPVDGEVLRGLRRMDEAQMLDCARALGRLQAVFEAGRRVDAGRLEAALAVLEPLQRREPRDREVAALAGFVHGLRTDPEAGWHALAGLGGADDGVDLAAVNAAFFAVLTRRDDLLGEAEQATAAALELLPDEPGVLRTHGAVLVATGSADAGERLLQQAWRCAEPRWLRGCTALWLAVAAARAGRGAEASAWVLRGRRLGRGHPGCAMIERAFADVLGTAARA